ncbi:DUF2303 family protein [Halomonas sp. SSL-5]|uniref:DUF2303 family protein n=1 Tax=Halomonas sp. SSL-5 TaxID=3065855 RepID=UPI00273847B0|nr:DUF2303 family protein [Halomonas sp. SSL-5]MDY7116557.1 DUF2303 family protein [Halomonas sp. SSL-5]
MSLTKEALEHLEASHKTGTEVLDGEALIMGGEFKLADLEKYRAMRRRFRGKFETQGIDDFTRYVGNNGPARAPVFIDRDAMAARCYLDIGHVHEPGHCEHSASLALPKTPEFTAFLRANGNTYDQDGIVELLEDWGHLMSFTNSQGEVLELRKVLHAFRKISIDDLTSIDSDKQEHSSQVGVMSKVTVKNAERLPAAILWHFSPYDGLQTREFSMRVASLTKGGPGFRLRAIALDAITAAIAEEFAGSIEEALPELECLQGTFSP